MKPTRTAAALIIGNELLTGKVQDVNVAALATELFALGIALRRVVFVGDEVEAIAEELNTLRTQHDLVFTSGGIGPTHDDVTMAAVGRAVERPLVRSEAILALLEQYFGGGLTEHHRRMADVPQGTKLVESRNHRWPTVQVENMFILPGLPEIFLRKLALLREVLDVGATFVSRAVRTGCDEGTLAPLLERLNEDYPGVTIGSYPRSGDGPVRVVVTFDGTALEDVEQAAAGLLNALPAHQIIEHGEP
jgi:molybdenum cofactor synthesis domain-containing protein